MSVTTESFAYHLARGSWPARALRTDCVALPLTLEAPSLARRALALHLRGLCRPVELSTLRLLVSELVTNAVRHARRDQERVVLHYAVAADRLRVEVCDPGAGLPEPLPPSPHADGGYGLQLVDLMASRWGHACTEGSCVWFELDREGRPAAL